MSFSMVGNVLLVCCNDWPSLVESELNPILLKQNVSKRKLHSSCNKFRNVLMASISKQEKHAMVFKFSILI
jgi:hypothetical protein